MKRSEMALIANESEAVVFEERECSLELLLRFGSSQNEGRKIRLRIASDQVKNLSSYIAQHID